MNQHWLSDEFKHRRRQETHEVSFWKGHTASDEAAADLAVLEVHDGSYTNRIEFQWPAERPALANIERMFERVFEKGRTDAKRELREFLGIPRS